MIHHISIAARDTRHVAEVLSGLFNGALTRFGPYRDSWIAWAADEQGTAIEVYPVGTEMYPPDRPGQAQFRHNPDAGAHGATHATPPTGCCRTTDRVPTPPSRMPSH